MFVKYRTLQQMLREAFDAGLESSQEVRNQVVWDIICNHKVAKSPDLTIYTVEELRKFPVGSKFFHSFLGRGEIVNKKGVKAPFMKFENGSMHSFQTDQSPWDIPMVHLVD